MVNDWLYSMTNLTYVEHKACIYTGWKALRRDTILEYMYRHLWNRAKRYRAMLKYTLNIEQLFVCIVKLIDAIYYEYGNLFQKTTYNIIIMH